MKKHFPFLLAILLLLQSCKSYDNFDIKTQEIVDDKTYKISKNSKFTKIKVVSVVDSVLTYRIGKYEQKIHLREIDTMKYKKFDTAKTVGFAIGTATLLFIAAYSTIDFKIQFTAPISIP